MKRVAGDIPGYTYGTAEVPTSPVSLQDLAQLKISAGFTEDDEVALRHAGDVLADQTKAIVDQWRGEIIARIPNLARHSHTPEGETLPDYSARSGLRFQQWILDTCFRPYDQDWLNYQQEIALRHTALKKNATDGVRSTPYVPLRDIVAFIAVINETIRPYLTVQGDVADEVDRMHRAWCKSMQMQIALWSRPYTDAEQAPNEW